MATHANPAPQLSSGNPKGGRTMLIGMAFFATGFGLFYMNMQRSQKKKEIAGRIPSYERRLAYAGANIHEDPTETLKASRVEAREEPFAPISRERNSKHMTTAEFAANPDMTDAHRRMVPPPQRPKSAGSDVPYTKRQDFVPQTRHPH